MRDSVRQSNFEQQGAFTHGGQVVSVVRSLATRGDKQKTKKQEEKAKENREESVAANSEQKASRAFANRV